MADPALGQLVASVLEKVMGSKPTDNVFTSQALLNLLKSGNGFKSVDGGRVIEETLEYAENTTFKSYSDLETLDTTRIDVFDCARFDWKEIGGTVVISELERARASGSSEKFDLVTSKVNNGKNSMMAVINRQMYAAGTANGGKDIGGLALLVAATATSGTVGGINRAVFPFFRNRSNSAGDRGKLAYVRRRFDPRNVYDVLAYQRQQRPQELAARRVGRFHRRPERQAVRPVAHVGNSAL